MTECKLYPPIPSALPEALGPHSVDVPPQIGYHLNMVLAKRRGLIDKKKYKKYNRILIIKTNDLILNLTPENVTQHSRIE